MNSLSWLIYVADIVGNIKVIGALIIIMMIASSIMFLMSFPWESDCYGDDVELPRRARKISAKVFILCIIGTILSIFIPSSKTIWLIAGSEIGENVLAKPETQEVLGDVYTIIQSKVKELKDKEVEKKE